VKSQKYNELTLHWLNFLGDFPALLVISIAVLAASFLVEIRYSCHPVSPQPSAGRVAPIHTLFGNCAADGGRHR